jgi:hypothetical protein
MARRALRTSCAIVLLAALFLPAAGAAARDPQGQVATTNKGGSCRLEAALSRSGGAISYGGRVHACSARFGIREVRGRALLYQGINTAETVGDSSRQQGGIPFEISQSFTGQSDEHYESRFDVTVVINGGKSRTKPKRPEKWKDPGPGCRVMTQRRSGDTLGCTFGIEAPPAG